MTNLPLYQNTLPLIHTEDLYFFDGSGRVVLSRCDKDWEFSNIFSLVSERDRHFIIESSKIPEMYSYLLVESKIGPLLILRSLYPYFKLLLAIAPRFDEDSVFAIAKSRRERFFPTDECAARIDSDKVASIVLDNRHKRFLSRLDSCFRNASGHLTRRLSLDGLITELEDCVLSLAELIGCELTVSFDKSIYEYKDPNRFSGESFLLSMIYLTMLARRCSASRSAAVLFSAHEHGFYFSIEFNVCSDLADVEKIIAADELLALRRQIYTRPFPCNATYAAGRFKATCFCWSSVTEGDLKTAQQLVYNDEILKEGDKIWLEPIPPQ